MIGIRLRRPACASLARAQNGPPLRHPDGPLRYRPTVQWRIETTNTATNSSITPSQERLIAVSTERSNSPTALASSKPDSTRRALRSCWRTPGQWPPTPGSQRCRRVPSAITASAPRPPTSTRSGTPKSELQAVPANQSSNRRRRQAGFDYWKITMDNIRGSHIRASLPAAHRRKFPRCSSSMGRRLSPSEKLSHRSPRQGLDLA
jgi:hypothetical protein